MNMRERIARALFTQNEAGDIAWDTCPQEIRDEHLASADAALSAMEEPTEAMVGAGTRAYDEGDGEYGIYRAMIRAASEPVSNPDWLETEKMNILTKDEDDFLDRAIYSIKRAKPTSSLVVGQADDQA